MGAVEPPVSTSTPLGTSTATTGTSRNASTVAAASGSQAASGRRCRRSRRAPRRAAPRTVSAASSATTRPPAARSASSPAAWVCSGLSSRADTAAPRRARNAPAHNASPPLSPGADQQQHPGAVHPAEELADRMRQPGRRALHQRAVGQPGHQLRLGRPHLLHRVRAPHAATLVPGVVRPRPPHREAWHARPRPVEGVRRGRRIPGRLGGMSIPAWGPLARRQHGMLARWLLALGYDHNHVRHQLDARRWAMRSPTGSSASPPGSDRRAMVVARRAARRPRGGGRWSHRPRGRRLREWNGPDVTVDGPAVGRRGAVAGFVSRAPGATCPG